MEKQPNTITTHAYVHPVETQAFETVRVGVDGDVYIFLPTDCFEVVEPSLDRSVVTIRMKR